MNDKTTKIIAFALLVVGVGIYFFMGDSEKKEDTGGGSGDTGGGGIELPLVELETSPVNSQLISNTKSLADKFKVNTL